MSKNISYLKKYLPFILGILFLCVPDIANASWFGDAAEWIAEQALNALGFDTSDRCSLPQPERQSCLFCPMFEIIFNTGSIMAGKSYNLFGKDLANVVLIYLAVCLALIVLKYVSSMGGKDAGSLMNDITRKTFAAAVVYLILAKNYYYIFGGRDESSFQLIQGITLAGIFYDEVALMPRSFVEQAMARCSIKGSRVYFNCNPERPSHWFKQEWIDKHESKKAKYLHFTMDDNF